MEEQQLATELQVNQEAYNVSDPSTTTAGQVTQVVSVVSPVSPVVSGYPGMMEVKMDRSVNSSTSIGNYDENMQPWYSNPSNYFFTAYTLFDLNVASKPQGCCASNVSNVAAEAAWSVSVYHKKESEMLIIKKRTSIGLLAQSKKNPMLGGGIVLIIIGILFLLMSAVSSDLVIIAVIFILLGICLLFCNNKQQGTADVFDLTTQAISINSIQYIDRRLAVFTQSTNPCCQFEFCRPNGDDLRLKLSKITIGFSSHTVSGSLGTVSNSITLELFTQQAYELQQYLNMALEKRKSEKKHCF